MTISKQKVGPVSREDAISFLESACRNWSKVPKLSEEDIGDVSMALLQFASTRLALSAIEQEQEQFPTADREYHDIDDPHLTGLAPLLSPSVCEGKVTEEMVERAYEAFVAACEWSDWDEPEVRGYIRAALTAALSQEGA